MITQELKTKYLSTLRALFDKMVQSAGPEEAIKTTLTTLNSLSTEFQAEVKAKQAALKELDQDITGAHLMLDELKATGQFDADKLFEYSLPKDAMNKLDNTSEEYLRDSINSAEMAIVLYDILKKPKVE